MLAAVSSQSWRCSSGHGVPAFGNSSFRLARPNEASNGNGKAASVSSFEQFLGRTAPLAELADLRRAQRSLLVVPTVRTLVALYPSASRHANIAHILLNGRRSGKGVALEVLIDAQIKRHSEEGIYPRGEWPSLMVKMSKFELTAFWTVGRITAWARLNVRLAPTAGLS
jgi:hypothetical protein